MTNKKFSIITVCFNSENTISNTIESVNNQQYLNIEHIFIDGNSSDNTLKIIDRMSTVNKIVVSEKDNGIYDAMNKGFKLASGEIIAFLNSDDFYADVNVLSDVSSTFEKSNYDLVYGNIEYINDSENIVRRWNSKPVPSSLRYGFQIPHPALFVKKNLLLKLDQAFDPEYKIVGDLKQQLLLIEKFNAKGMHFNRTLTKMRIGGVSTNNYISYILGWKEARRAYNEVFFSLGGISAFLKFIQKIKSIIRV
jgi:glycosyltransferase involved in cell wall biosynthesis